MPHVWFDGEFTELETTLRLSSVGISSLYTSTPKKSTSELPPDGRPATQNQSAHLLPACRTECFTWAVQVCDLNQPTCVARSEGLCVIITDVLVGLRW